MHELRKELSNVEVCNANVLDALLKNPKRISDELKKIDLFFWGTIYVDPMGILKVRCLRFNTSIEWHWFYRCAVCDILGNSSPAAVFQ